MDETAVLELRRDLKPQVVVTFNKYGGYGHPDHIAIQRATVAAFTLASAISTACFAALAMLS